MVRRFCSWISLEGSHSCFESILSFFVSFGLKAVSIPDVSRTLSLLPLVYFCSKLLSFRMKASSAPRYDTEAPILASFTIMKSALSFWREAYLAPRCDTGAVINYASMIETTVLCPCPLSRNTIDCATNFGPVVRNLNTITQ